MESRQNFIRRLLESVYDSEDVQILFKNQEENCLQNEIYKHHYITAYFWFLKFIQQLKSESMTKEDLVHK